MIDYSYGINSNILALHDPFGNRNIGSFLQATVTVPVWNWGSTRSKVRQAKIAQQQSQNDLEFRPAPGGGQSGCDYLEARAARTQLAQLLDTRTLAEENLRLTTLRYDRRRGYGAGNCRRAILVPQTRAMAMTMAWARYRMALANLEILMGRY